MRFTFVGHKTAFTAKQFFIITLPIHFFFWRSFSLNVQPFLLYRFHEHTIKSVFTIQFLTYFQTF
jgi:hypothetical protein